MNISMDELKGAFTLWDTEYRESPEEFMSFVEHLLRTTPDDYGDEAAACLVAYIKKIRKQSKDK